MSTPDLSVPGWVPIADRWRWTGAGPAPMSPPPVDSEAAAVIADAFDKFFRDKHGGKDDRIVRLAHRDSARRALEALRDAGYVVIFAEMDGV